MSKTHDAPLFCVRHRMGHRKTEDGNIVDQAGTILVMGFMIAMILVYACYGKMVQQRLAIDNIAKEYLYQMEEQGCLTAEMQTKMTNQLTSMGISGISFAGTTNLGNNQATYGSSLTLVCSMEFDNPLYSLMSSEKRGSKTLFTIVGLNRKIKYTTKMTGTSKW